MSNPYEIDVILANPSTSFWLKNAVETSLKRDAVDALVDAEALVQILKTRLETIEASFAVTHVITAIR